MLRRLSQWPLVALALAADVGAWQPTPHGAATRTPVLQSRACGTAAEGRRRGLGTTLHQQAGPSGLVAACSQRDESEDATAPLPLSRRKFLERTGGAAAGFLAVPRVAVASPVSPAGSDLPALPPGVVVLRVAEVTEKMEQVILQAVCCRVARCSSRFARVRCESAQKFFLLTVPSHPPWLSLPPLVPQALYQQQGEGEEIVIGRPQMQQSIKILLEKTQLERMPNSDAAVRELRSISSIAGEGQGPLAARELKDIARAYSRAREALRLVFESFSEVERDECKRIFRQMQAQDRARLESA